MAIYAIGDIQGCFDDLLRLLDKLHFNEHQDQLWFAGDLVNRGPKSLETLRFVKNLGNSAVCVLGNHDLHLLAASCMDSLPEKWGTLSAVLQATDRDELLTWLRHRPLFHEGHGFCLVHAGLPPQWNFDMAKQAAKLVEQVLASDYYRDFLTQMYGNYPDKWSPGLSGVDQLRFIVNCFTRMRYCTQDGRLDFQHTGPIGSQPLHLMPWFAVTKRLSRNLKIIFGHWSSLGYYEGYNCYAIDSGCLWGRQLTAIKLGDVVQPISIDCLRTLDPVLSD